MFTKSAQLKASLCTVLFSGAGLYSWFYLVTDHARAISVLALYVMLVIHAYYSVRIFATITPSTIVAQNIIDAILFMLYLAMAFSIGSFFFFSIFAVIMFIIATAKYSLLLSLNEHKVLLQRKILVDTIGILGFFCTFLGVVLGYPAESTLLFSWAFFFVSIFLFFIKPLYTFNQ